MPVVCLLEALARVVGRSARAPVYRRSGVAHGRDEQPGQPGDDRDQRRTAPMTGADADDLARNPPSAIAIDIAPNTSANRKPMTRPSSSGGVRSWNIVWLGMTNIMFAMPGPEHQPERDRQVAA